MPFPFAFARLNALQTAVRHSHTVSDVGDGRAIDNNCRFVDDVNKDVAGVSDIPTIVSPRLEFASRDARIAPLEQAVSLEVLSRDARIFALEQAISLEVASRNERIVALEQLRTEVASRDARIDDLK